MICKWCSKDSKSALYCTNCGERRWIRIILNGLFCLPFVIGGFKLSYDYVFSHKEIGYLLTGLLLIYIFYFGFGRVAALKDVIWSIFSSKEAKISS
jgi:hypothetical protein